MVRVGDVCLFALETNGESDNVYVCVRAEEVTLEKSESVAGSARNRLKGVILEIMPGGIDANQCWTLDFLSSVR